jgi:hypothetical protein
MSPRPRPVEGLPQACRGRDDDSSGPSTRSGRQRPDDGDGGASGEGHLRDTSDIEEAGVDRPERKQERRAHQELALDGFLGGGAVVGSRGGLGLSHIGRTILPCW